MPKNSLDALPEVFVSTTELSSAVSRASAQGRLRKLASRLYTRNLTDAPEALIRRHLWPIVGSLFPGALIADRTALELAPAADGSIFLVSVKKRDLALPGIVIRPRKGPGPLPTDRPFLDGLFLASTARAFLENLQASRARRGIARTLSRADIEERLDAMLRRGGEAALNRLRDEARGLAAPLGQEDAFDTLDWLIGALLSTRDAPLSSPLTRARAAGMAYDPERVRLFEVLHRALRDTAPGIRPSPAGTRSVLPFFEAYFSNFIEGTEFELEEAAGIVFDGRIPVERPADAHDILGTYRIVADRMELARTPGTFDQLLSLLQARHANIMEGRPDKGPGRFKQSVNRAGTTVFVSPALVRGTLAAGFALHKSLETAFARAVFMMFLVSEVHPFADGNGRLARVMMNAELVAEGEERIIIPTIYRNNYLSALKALSQTGEPEPLIRTLDFAQRYTGAIDWSALDPATAMLQATHAFLDPYDAEGKGIRLRLPTL